MRFSKVCRLFLYEVLKCARVQAFHDMEPNRGPAAPSQSFARPGVRGHLDSSAIRIAGGHHEEDDSFAFCVCGLLAVGLIRAAAPRQLGGQQRPNAELVTTQLRHPSLPLQGNLTGYSESDSQ